MMYPRGRVVRTLLTAPLLVSSLAAARPDSPEDIVTNERSVLVRLAGDDLSATTLVPQIATRLLASRGAANITISPGQQPWTSEIAGRLLGGRRVAILVRASSTADGFRMLDRGLADIALAARRPTPLEREHLAHLGDLNSGAASYAMGASALTMAVHRSNHVQSLSSGELLAIYTGRITDWSQIGGTAGPIHAYARAAGSGAASLFTQLFMGDARYVPNVHTFSSFAQVRAALFGDSQALAYLPVNRTSGLHTVRLRVRERFAASPDSYGLQSGDYPFGLTLALYRSPNNSSASIADFFREAASPQSQIDTIAAGYARLDPALLVSEPLDGAPAAYVDVVHRALRVSTTIRFDSGSIAIDGLAKRDLDRLADYLRFLRAPNDKLRHIAFCDDSGDGRRNTESSKLLALVVIAELKRRRVYPGEIVSLGATVPLASDSLPAGRRINRRVETWILP